MPQKTIEGLHDLMIVKLKTIYEIEQETLKAMPKMEMAATNPELKKGFNMHYRQTEGQVKRLEEIFGHFGMNPEPEKSDAVRGMIADAEWCIQNIQDADTLDAALIASAQGIEHLEIAAYGSAAAWAEAMGHKDVKNLLGQTLEEEKANDEKLSQLAMSKVNVAADMGEEGEDKSVFGKLQTAME